MGWISEETKNRAKQANLITFLQEQHPELIFQRESGEYAYTKRTCITFYKGRDGVYRYCDQQKRKENQPGYVGDSIKFLRDYVGGYNFETAVLALCQYAD